MAVTAKQASVVHEGSTLGRRSSLEKMEIVECGCKGSPHTGQRGRLMSAYNNKTGNYERFVVWDYDLENSRTIPKDGEPGACVKVKKYKMVQTVAKNFAQAKAGDIIYVRLAQQGENGWHGRAVVVNASTLTDRYDFTVRAMPIEKDGKGRFSDNDYFYVYEWDLVDEREYIAAKEAADAAALKAREREVTARTHERKAREVAAEAMRLKAIAEAERDAMVALVARLREEPEHLIQFHADRVEKVTLIDGDETGVEHVYEAAALRLTPWEEK